VYFTDSINGGRSKQSFTSSWCFKLQRKSMHSMRHRSPLGSPFSDVANVVFFNVAFSMICSFVCNVTDVLYSSLQLVSPFPLSSLLYASPLFQFCTWLLVPAYSDRVSWTCFDPLWTREWLEISAQNRVLQFILYLHIPFT
jgi:hypothetical protein